jgi:hypothetical protein
MNLSHVFTVEFLKYLNGSILTLIIKLLNLWTEILAHHVFKHIPIDFINIVMIIKMGLLQIILMFVKLVNRSCRYIDGRLKLYSLIFIK